MRLQGPCLLVTATVIVLSAHAAEDATEGRGRPITILASPSILPKGAACRVDLRPETKGRRETVTVAYEGKVTEATDRGLKVTVTLEEQLVVQETPVASGIPYLGRLFRNIGIGRSRPEEAKDVWIPAERIRSVSLRPDPRPEAPGASD